MYALDVLGRQLCLDVGDRIEGKPAYDYNFLDIFTRFDLGHVCLDANAKEFLNISISCLSDVLTARLMGRPPEQLRVAEDSTKTSIVREIFKDVLHYTKALRWSDGIDHFG